MSTTNPTQQTTEWDDLQRKFGNLPPLEKEIKEEQIYLETIDKLENEDFLSQKNLKELNRLEEDCMDDEYLKIIQKYKNDRLNEIKRNKALDIFGDVYEITKENFIEEINDASKLNPLNNFINKDSDYDRGKNINEYDAKQKEEPEKEKQKQEQEQAMRMRMMINKKDRNRNGGTYVILHMYSENVMACKILNNIIKEAAQKYRYVKFAKGVYNKIVENYPESKMPTILIYYNGVCVQQLCNVLMYIDGGLPNLNLKSFEQLLKKFGIIKIKKKEKKRNDALSDDSDEDDREDKQNRKTQKQYTAFNMFNRKYNNDGDDEDNDDSSADETEKEEEEEEEEEEGGSASKTYASSYLDNQRRKYKL